MTRGLYFAVALARSWVRVYTSGLPAEQRDTRRAEIESDLWEHQHDARQTGAAPLVAAMEIVLRALMGIPHDLRWRGDAIQTRDGDLERRVAFMILSRTHIRWMGLAGILGGLVWAGGFIMPVRIGPVLRGYGHIALAMLFIVGLLACYAQQRDRANRAGRTGFILLFTSFTAWLLVNVLGTVLGVDDSSLAMNLLAVTWVFLLPPGFLLLGLGLRRVARVVPLAVGAVFAAWMLVPRALYAWLFPSVTNWNRGDTPIGGAAFFVMGVGVALMALTAYREATSIRSQTPSH